MKKFISIAVTAAVCTAALGFVFGCSSPVLDSASLTDAGAVLGKVSLENAGAGAMEKGADPKGVSIQEGTLTYAAGHYLAGNPLTAGFDAYGYNYQAHIFKGSYVNVYLGRDGYPPLTGND